MARIAGVNIPLNKRVEVGLTYVYGVGQSTARKIVEKAGVDPNTQVKDLTEDEIVKLRDAVEAQDVEGDLRRWRRPRYEPISWRRLMFCERSRRRSPSTVRSSSIAARSLRTSSSVRSLT